AVGLGLGLRLARQAVRDGLEPRGLELAGGERAPLELLVERADERAARAEQLAGDRQQVLERGLARQAAAAAVLDRFVERLGDLQAPDRGGLVDRLPADRARQRGADRRVADRRAGGAAGRGRARARTG